MKEDKNLIEKKIKELEAEMSSADFWSDKEKAKNIIQNKKYINTGLVKYDNARKLFMTRLYKYKPVMSVYIHKKNKPSFKGLKREFKRTFGFPDYVVY